MVHGVSRRMTATSAIIIIALLLGGSSTIYLSYESVSHRGITKTETSTTAEYGTLTVTSTLTAVSISAVTSTVTSTATSIYNSVATSIGTMTRTLTITPPPSTTTVTATVTATATKSLIYVDSCGANPYDDLPDSTAIQTCIDRAASGDTILFTSPGGLGYKGYLIDKTIFLVSGPPVRNHLTFASTSPARPALLNATDGLKGFVIQLYARSRVSGGQVDNIVLSNLQVDGGRDRRVAYGPDQIANGIDDSWGSWLPECPLAEDSRCVPGGVSMSGAMNFSDPSQNYAGHPDSWSAGNVVEGMVIQNVESVTALEFDGASGTIRNNVIEGAGDPTFADGCPPPDGGNDPGEWADGITLTGPNNTVTGNLIRDASDVGIAFFGGKNTVISNNVVVADPGNNGMFAGIAVHTWFFGDVSGVQIVGNRVENDGSAKCGGIHAGINIGPQMWGGGCVSDASTSTVGDPGTCSSSPSQPKGSLCTAGQPCQVWTYVSKNSSLILEDNFVRGAQVNYLVDGLDLVGSFVAVGNISDAPAATDWHTAAAGCSFLDTTTSWGTYDFVAHNPSIPGWADVPIFCER